MVPNRAELRGAPNPAEKRDSGRAPAVAGPQRGYAGRVGLVFGTRLKRDTACRCTESGKSGTIP